MGTVTDFARETEDAADNETFDPTALASAKPKDETTASEAIPFDDTGEAGDNGKDYAAAAKLIYAIEKQQAEIDRINAEAMDEKAPHRDKMKDLKQAVRDEHSIEAKALSLILAKRKAERRIKEREAALEEPAKGQFDQLEMAL